MPGPFGPVLELFLLAPAIFHFWPLLALALFIQGWAGPIYTGWAGPISLYGVIDHGVDPSRT